MTGTGNLKKHHRLEALARRDALAPAWRIEASLGIADSGARLTAEIRNDGSATVPQRDARLFMRFDPARAALLPDETAKA